METIRQIFGEGKDLSLLQMCCRGIAVFFITLALIRISGRRSFGMKTSLDNIIVILLGALLSRAVVGASPFLPVVVTSLVIVILHRLLGWISIHNRWVQHMLEGTKILLFDRASFQKKNMNRALVCVEDIMQGLRRTALTEDLEKVEKIYIERNGEISIVEKSQSDH